jgi:AcrR family transcriptional regulator
MQRDGDLTARARIRNAAFALIAEHGVPAATVRAIARRAGVSPALVIHHYGSKQGVLDEISAVVVDVLETNTRQRDDDTDIDPVRAHRRRQLRFERLLAEVPQLGAYVSRMVLDGTPDGLAWFRRMVDSMVAELAHREELGVARPPDDLRAAAAMLILLGFAPVLLRAALEHALDVDFDDEAARRRWWDAESELLTSPLYPTGDRSGDGRPRNNTR